MNIPIGTKKTWIKISITVIILVIIGWMSTLWYNSHYVSKEIVQQNANNAARTFCLRDNTPEYCSTIKITKIKGPVEYFPQDGNDVYHGNWLVTFKADSTPKKQIFIALNLRGEVVYINTSGSIEFPFRDDLER